MSEMVGDNTKYSRLRQLFDTNFLDYTSYVIRERAIPDIDDGLKPVQRRILQTLHNIEDARYHKVANVVGETMKLHPHGDASIFSALVNIANKEYLIDRQGNFGNIFTGDQASAARYIECRLTPLAKETLFNQDITEFIASYDGRMQEPVSLPSKIPLLLMLGAEGIAVGMATKIMPHNFDELLQAQIKYLQGKEFAIYPDFPRGGIIDASHYEDGNGKLRCRAKIVEHDEKTILIKELPYNLTTQGLIDSIEKAARTGKLKIASINDYTAEEVEIEIKLPRGVYAKETIDGLYAFTDCEISISPSLIVIKNNNPCQLSVTDVITHNSDKLVRDLEKELRIELGRLREKFHARRLEQIFIEERLYKQIEEINDYQKIIDTVKKSIEPFAKELLRKITNDDIDKLLEIKIRRISRYDINRQQKEIKTIEKEIKIIDNHLKDMVVFTISYLKSLLKKFGPSFPRQSTLEQFGEVDARKAALTNIQLWYHRKNGFLGFKVNSEDNTNDLHCNCSEYDRILLIFKNGVYKVINIVDKIFIGSELLWMGIVEKDRIFNVIYRNGKNNFTYIKRFKTPKFITGKEYRLFDEHRQSMIQLLLIGDDKYYIRVIFAPSSRAKYNSLEIALDDYLIKGVAAKGKRIGNRVVRRVTNITGKQTIQSNVPQSLPGFQVDDGDSHL